MAGHEMTRHRMRVPFHLASPTPVALTLWPGLSQRARR
jgi:hypothetical protein